MCGGDFNELLAISEKVGGSDRFFIGMFQFREAVDDCDLVDLGFSGSCFTWNNRRDGVDSIQERLDRFLADTSVGSGNRNRYPYSGRAVGPVF